MWDEIPVLVIPGRPQHPFSCTTCGFTHNHNGRACVVVVSHHGITMAHPTMALISHQRIHHACGSSLSAVIASRCATVSVGARVPEISPDSSPASFAALA